MKSKVRVLIIALFAIIIFSSPVFAYTLPVVQFRGIIDGDNEHTGNQYVVDSQKMLSFMTVNGTPYNLAYKVMRSEDGRDGSGFYVYCVDHILDSPSANWSYGVWYKMGPETTYILQNGYPYKSFTGDSEKDYYITNVALQIANKDKLGFNSSGQQVPTNLTAAEVEKGNCNDPHGLRTHIMKLVNDSKNSRHAYIDVGKITQLTKSGNSYITNKITLNAPSSIQKYDISLADGCTVESEEADGFKLRIPESVVQGDLNGTINKLKVKATFKGGSSALLGGVYGQQAVVVLQETDPVESTIGIDIEMEKIRVRKILSSTSGKLGQAKSEGAVYGIYSDSACTNKILELTVGANGYSNVSDFVIKQDYYAKELTAPAGTIKNNTVYHIDPNKMDGNKVVTFEATNNVMESTLKVVKKLGATDYDSEITLKGAQFKIYLKSDPSQVYYTNISGDDGICKVDNLPYGEYIAEEYIVPNCAYKVIDTTVNIALNNNTYTINLTDNPKEMLIQVNKSILLNNGEATDAKVKGAYFTVYKNSACRTQDEYRDKNGNKVIIGPTDENGYAISKKMLTGTYYLKETTFPEGIDQDKIIPGDNVTYRNKVYTASYDNTKQGTQPVTVSINVKNEPVRGDLEILKRLGATDYDSEINLSDTQFRATLISNRSCYFDSNISASDGICYISNLPYGTYEVEEILCSDSAYKVENFTVNIAEKGKKYSYTKVDDSKKMLIEVNKEILLESGEATDAKVSGAIFTVYKDSQCKTKYIDKNGNDVVVGPTDENGYAISKKMRTGTYYLKETTFPEGIDPNEIVPGENIKYKDKIYVASYDNTKQGAQPVTVIINVKNEPKRNDLAIYKKIDKTSNTPKFPLDKCEFTATLISSKGTNNVFSRKCEAETNENGYCIIKDLPYGEYEIEETKVSDISLKCSNFTIKISESKTEKIDPYTPVLARFNDGKAWVDEDGYIVDIPKVMQIKIRKTDYDKKDTDPNDYTQGDATLEGAKYMIYRYDPQTDDYTEYVYDITVDHKDDEGYWCAESRDLLVGKYSVKERVRYEEKGNQYSYARGYLVDPKTYYFDQRPDLQTEERSYHVDISKEKVIRGRIQVIKYDNNVDGTDDIPSVGAILRLKLNSNNDVYYDVKINKEGYGEFVEALREEYAPYTIPYGTYTISEIKESDKGEHTHFFIKAEPVTITKQGQNEHRILDDEPVPMYIKIQKRDNDTGALVAIAGAGFKIWDCKKSEFVSQRVYPGEIYQDIFYTNDKGELITPDNLLAGEYIIYETTAPTTDKKGYYLEDKWRLPENEKDYGKKDGNGKYVNINKAAMGVVENKEADKIELIYEVEMPDRPLMGKIEVEKKGLMFTDVEEDLACEYGNKYTPKFELRGLKDVKYEVHAAENIMSPDGKVIYKYKDELCGTIITDENGIGTSQELYLGKYYLVEIDAPAGVLVNTDPISVELINNDQLIRVKTEHISLTNDKQKVELSFKKEFDLENKYIVNEDKETYAVFGIYANEAINNYKGKEIIKKDNLIDVMIVNSENTVVKSNVDLPEGKYYYKEIYVTAPYVKDEEKYKFTVKYDKTSNPVIKISGKTVENTIIKADLYVIKLSSSSLIKGETLIGTNGINKDIEDEKLKDLYTQLSNKSLEEVKSYISDPINSAISLKGAKYAVFMDKDCTKPLKEKKENGDIVNVSFETDSNGMAYLTNIPLGMYYLKEIEAPVGYEKSEDIAEVELTLDEKNKSAYRILLDKTTRYLDVEKTDIFTGNLVPNCTFEIRKMDDTVIARFITNENGKAKIQLDFLDEILEKGEKYKFVELDAPDIYKEDGQLYKLNTEPHIFTFDYEIDENNNVIFKDKAVTIIENYRPTSDVTLEKLDFADSTPISNCKFELRSLETDFVVEGVTDENGIYVFKNIQYGKYTYTELEAPEEYIIDTEPHEIEINAKEMKIKITNEKAPDTGDIAVYAIAGVAVVCVLGIVFVVLKNKKKK